MTGEPRLNFPRYRTTPGWKLVVKIAVDRGEVGAHNGREEVRRSA